jgi:hypothetical protein
MLTQTRIQASSSSQAAHRATAAPGSAVHGLGGPIEMMGAVLPFTRGCEIYAGKVLTHRFLLGELWDEHTDAQYLRFYVRQLRQKIEKDPERPQYILTETGIGYRLRGPD